ncbi:hypothetical protein NQL31_000082 [Lotmaria passim]
MSSQNASPSRASVFAAGKSAHPWRVGLSSFGNSGFAAANTTWPGRLNSSSITSARFSNALFTNEESDRQTYKNNSNNHSDVVGNADEGEKESGASGDDEVQAETPPLTPQATAGAAGIEVGPATDDWSLQRLQLRILAARTQAEVFHRFTSAMEILLAVQMSLDADYQEATMTMEALNGTSNNSDRRWATVLAPEQRAFYATLVGQELQHVTALWMAKLQAGDSCTASPYSAASSSPRTASRQSWSRTSSSAVGRSTRGVFATSSRTASTSERHGSVQQQRVESTRSSFRRSTQRSAQMARSTSVQRSGSVSPSSRKSLRSEPAIASDYPSTTPTATPAKPQRKTSAAAAEAVLPSSAHTNMCSAPSRSPSSGAVAEEGKEAVAAARQLSSVCEEGHSTEVQSFNASRSRGDMNRSRSSQRQPRRRAPIRRRSYKMDHVELDSSALRELSSLLDDSVLGRFAHCPFEPDYAIRSRRSTTVNRNSAGATPLTSSCYHPDEAVYSPQERRISLPYGVPHEMHVVQERRLDRNCRRTSGSLLHRSDWQAGSQQQQLSFSQDQDWPRSNSFSPLPSTNHGHAIERPHPASANPNGSQPPFSTPRSNAATSAGCPACAPRLSPPFGTLQCMQQHQQQQQQQPDIQTASSRTLATSPLRTFTAQSTLVQANANADWHSTSISNTDLQQEEEEEKTGDEVRDTYAQLDQLAHRESRPFVTPPSSTSLSITTISMTSETDNRKQHKSGGYRWSPRTHCVYENTSITNSHGEPRRRLILQRVEVAASGTKSHTRKKKRPRPLHETSQQLDNDPQHRLETPTQQPQEFPKQQHTAPTRVKKRRTEGATEDTTSKTHHSQSSASIIKQPRTPPNETKTSPIHYTRFYYSTQLQRRSTATQAPPSTPASSLTELEAHVSSDEHAEATRAARKSVALPAGDADALSQPELEAHVSSDEHAEATRAARKSVALPAGDADALSQPELEAHVSSDEHAEATRAARKFAFVSPFEADGDLAGDSVFRRCGLSSRLLRELWLRRYADDGVTCGSVTSVDDAGSGALISTHDVISSSGHFVFSGDVVESWLIDEGYNLGAYYNSYRFSLPREEATGLKWCGRPVQNLRLTDGGSSSSSKLNSYHFRSSAKKEADVGSSGIAACSQRGVTSATVSMFGTSACAPAVALTGDSNTVPPRERLRIRRLREAEAHTYSEEMHLVLKNAEDGVFDRGGWRVSEHLCGESVSSSLLFLRHGVSEAEVLSEVRRGYGSRSSSRPATAGDNAPVATATDAVVAAVRPRLPPCRPSLTRRYGAPGEPKTFQRFAESSVVARDVNRKQRPASAAVSPSAFATRNNGGLARKGAGFRETS